MGTRKERQWTFKNQLNKDLLRTEGTDSNKESLVLGIECMSGTVKNIFLTLSHLFFLTNIHPFVQMRTAKLKKQTKRESKLTKVSTASKAPTGSVSTGILFIASCLQTASDHHKEGHESFKNTLEGE